MQLITNLIEHNFSVWLSINRWKEDLLFDCSIDELKQIKLFLSENGKRINENVYVYVMYTIPLVFIIEYNSVIRLKEYKF